MRERFLESPISLVYDPKMFDIDILKKLLGQSQEEFSKYLENGESDVFAEAGELLWECMKIDVAQVIGRETDNINALKSAVSQMGETYNQLFYQCYHFHSWYIGGVPNDFALEKKLYLKTAKSLEKLIKNRETNRKIKKKAIENVALAV